MRTFALPSSYCPDTSAPLRDSARSLCTSSASPAMVCWSDGRRPFVNRAGLALARSMGRGMRRQFAHDLNLALAKRSQLSEHSRLGAHADCSLHPLLDEGRMLGVLVILAAAQTVEPEAKVPNDHAAVIALMDHGYCRIEVLDQPDGQLLDYRFLEINPAFARHTGRADLLGRRVSEAVEERNPFWAHACQEVLATGRTMHVDVPMGIGGRSYETCIMRLGGPESRQLAVLIKDTSRQTLAQQRLEQSERQAREAALRAEAAHRRLAAVVEATSAAVVVVDNDYKVLVMNSAARELRGSSPEFGPMRAVDSWSDGSPRDGRPLQSFEWPMWRALRGETTRDLVQIDVPEESRFCGHFLVTAAPIRSASGTIEGAVSVSFNITDRVMAERALKSASERKDEFLAMLGHELRNPLAPIAAAAELLRRPQASAEQILEGSAIIARQAQHLRGLVDDLLDVSRVSRGLINLERRLLDVRELLREALEQSQPLLQERGHHLHFKLSVQALRVRGDAKRLVQVLANLLNNAVKYTPPGGRLS